MLYHNKHNLTRGEVQISWHGTLFATCDGLLSDRVAVLELIKDTYRDNGGDWNGRLITHSPTRWEIIDGECYEPWGEGKRKTQ